MTAASDRLLRRLEWQVLRRLDGRLQGGHRTVWRGVGIDFADLRTYTPEDDVRHIDWNVTARMDEPFVRQYTEDRELTAWLVLDRSASMRVGGDGHGKASVLTELALCLARLLSQHGNRVGAVLYDNAHQLVLPPRSGRTQTLRLAHELDRPAPAGKAGATTDLSAMLRLAATTARRRSLFLVLSDFIGEPGWERALTLLSHRHEVVAVRIVDPSELRLPDLGLVVIEDAETGEQLLVDTGDPLLRRRFAAQVRERESELAGTMRRAGVAAHRVTTDTDLVDALVGMVRHARRRPR
ncbi:DUF58 domain-containing protein [Catellatospora sp. NPDC049609]|uniref:DUF58 domain-containing protein n=1 Tax=Catellatospora sp. NPDC049609 TaxID=3155505 RepID=UPI00342B7C1C